MEETDLSEQTDDEIQARLGGEATRGPQRFRGRTLATFSRGLRDLVIKVVHPEDTLPFHDVALIHILSEAYDPTPEGRVKKRAALIAASDDVAAFRARVSVEFFDDLSDEDFAEARRVAQAILAPAELAQVGVIPPPGQKKSADASPTKPSRMKKRSPSSSSPA